jgi:mannitol/fructose-specific phosphotransferase system IIA component (Ntr-type)
MTGIAINDSVNRAKEVLEFAGCLLEAKGFADSAVKN